MPGPEVKEVVSHGRWICQSRWCPPYSCEWMAFQACEWGSLTWTWRDQNPTVRCAWYVLHSWIIVLQALPGKHHWFLQDKFGKHEICGAVISWSRLAANKFWLSPWRGFILCSVCKPVWLVSLYSFCAPCNCLSLHPMLPILGHILVRILWWQDY